MASRPNDLVDLLELTRQVGDLRKAGKLADAMPLAERLSQLVEAPGGTDPLEVAGALIELAELLIAFDRVAEAEPLLQRALDILRRQSGGEVVLWERLSHVDTSMLVQSVAELRGLLAGMRRGGIRYSLDPLGAPSRPSSEEREKQEGVSQSAPDAHREWAEPPKPRPLAPTRTPPAASAPAPRSADMKRERVALKGKLASRAAAPDLEARSIELASFSGSSQHKPDPSTPQGALAIEAGRLAYQIPDRMWVGVQETVEVRLGSAIANEIMHGFIGRGDVKVEGMPIVETMKVSLLCQPGTFDIEPRSEEVQLVKPDLVKGTAFHQDDFARWMWLVTPRQRGKHTLLVKVSAAIRDSRGWPTTSSLPDKIIAGTVRVHLVQATVGAIRYVAPLVLSGVVTALVGIFTKDYWWPYVRDTVWPAVAALAGM